MGKRRIAFDVTASGQAINVKSISRGGSKLSKVTGNRNIPDLTDISAADGQMFSPETMFSPEVNEVCVKAINKCAPEGTNLFYFNSRTGQIGFKFSLVNKKTHTRFEKVLYFDTLYECCIFYRLFKEMPEIKDRSGNEYRPEIIMYIQMLFAFFSAQIDRYTQENDLIIWENIQTLVKDVALDIREMTDGPEEICDFVREMSMNN